LRGSKAKSIRREVYGDGVSGPRGREYRMAFGRFTAGAKRAEYQRAKKQGKLQLYFVAFGDSSAAKGKQTRGVVIVERATISEALAVALRVSPEQATTWAKFVYPISAAGPELKELELDRYYTDVEMKKLGYKSKGGVVRRKEDQ
jgi:hypothetical protein